MARFKRGSGTLCRRPENWPPTDCSAWQAALQGVDLVGPEKPGADWSERSRIKTARGYGR
jgi:hypothetical protein